MNKKDAILLEQAYTKISEHHGDEEFPESILKMTVGDLLDHLSEDPVERELYVDLEDWIANSDLVNNQGPKEFNDPEFADEFADRIKAYDRERR